MDAGTYKYRGFISYSHQDRRWGEWLHRALENYRVPKRLVGTAGLHGPVPARLFPIFRDRDELSTAGVLADELRRALADSHSFLLVCSPAASASRWVNEEVLQFKRLGGERRIYCLIVDGEPNASDAGRPELECFPPALRYRLGPDGELSDERAEPLAADARDAGDGREHARLKIIAGLLGVGFDDLRQRDLQTRNRRLGWLAAGSTAMAALTLSLAVWAVIAQRAAEKSRQQGEDLIGFMLGDLRAKLEPLGKLDILDAVGDKAMAYFDQLDNRNLSEAALAARAKALRQIGDVRFQQGRPADAAQAIDAALALNRELSRRHPEDADLQFELGQTEFWVGFAALRAKQLDRAGGHFEAYRTISQGLVDRDPKNPRWQLEVAYAENNLAALSNARVQYDDSLAHARRAALLLEAIELKTDDVLASLANAYSWQGSALQRLGRLSDALSVLNIQADIARNLAENKPGDMRRKYDLARKLSALGYAALAADDDKTLLTVSRDGSVLAATLVRNDESNDDYRYLLAAHNYIVAGAALRAGHEADARVALGQVRASLREILARDAARSDARILSLASDQMAFDLALRQANLAQATAALQQARSFCSDDVLNPVSLLTSEPYRCANTILRQWELAIARNAGASVLNALRTELDQTLVASNAVWTDVDRRSLKARQAVLDHRSAEGIDAIRALMQNGYRPLDLTEFIWRHCTGVSASFDRAQCDPALLALDKKKVVSSITH